jgi:hypothetical protein
MYPDTNLIRGSDTLSLGSEVRGPPINKHPVIWLVVGGAKGLIFDGGRIFLLSKKFRPPVGPNQHLIQWVVSAVSRWQGGRNVKLITKLYTLPRERI